MTERTVTVTTPSTYIGHARTALSADPGGARPPLRIAYAVVDHAGLGGEIAVGLHVLVRARIACPCFLIALLAHVHFGRAVVRAVDRSRMVVLGGRSGARGRDDSRENRESGAT